METNTTLKEIAQIAGYSVSTISKALRNSEEISHKSKTKIKEIATLLNYRPNKKAVSLRSGKTFCIAVIIPSIEDPFYARIFHGIQSEIANTNYSIISCISNESIEKEKHFIQKVYDQVDAFIISLSKETIAKNEVKHLKIIQQSLKPLVLIDRVIENIKCCEILSDDKNDIKTITTKVFNDGYKNVALVSNTKNINNKLKIKGFLEAPEIHKNYDIKKYLLNSNAQKLPIKLKALISNYYIDCIIALEEDTTFNTLKILKQKNIRIPEDIALIGYMSEHIAENLDISVTTINQHRKTMGIKAVQQILGQLGTSKLSSIKNIKIQSTLVNRQSYTR